MSTILDALKKSEQERKLNDIPTLSDMPAPQEKSLVPSFWLLAVIVVLLVCVLAAIVYFGSQAETVVSGQTATQTVQPVEDELVVNVVSWSEQVEQRFVIINGKLARQGEFARPGLKVEEIKPNSVILLERGKRIERRP